MEAYIDGNSSGFTEEEFLDVKKCLETLLSIRAGSQPMDRELGIDIDRIVGYPLGVARNMLSLEIIEKVGRYEPRVEVTSVTFADSAEGQLIPQVHFIKAEG